SLPAEIEHDLGDGALVLGEEIAAEGVAQRARELVGTPLRSRLCEEVDVDLELARADRRLHPVSVPSRIGERLGDSRLGRAEETEDGPPGAGCTFEHTPYRLRLDSTWPEPAQLARWARKRDDDAAVRLQHDARGRAGEPERDRALRKGRLLPDADRELGVRPFQAVGDHLRDLPDLELKSLVHDELAARGLRDQLDRPIVVRRAEPARHEAEIPSQPICEGAPEGRGTGSDDRYPPRVEPEALSFCREERAVPVLPVTADELATRDDDRRPRAR